MNLMHPQSATLPHKAVRSLALWSALTFVLMLMAGFGLALASFRHVPASDWEGLAEPKQWLNGDSTRRSTANLNAHFLPSVFFAKLERAVTWTMLGDAGPSVRTGCPNWFFLTEELEIFEQAGPSAKARAGIVAAVSANLKAQGIHLMVALVPDKTRIEHAHLCGLHRSNAFGGRLDQWLAEVQHAGVDAISLEDALTELSSERYYRTDSHWNEFGAEAAAKAIARHLHTTQRQPPPLGPPDPTRLQRQTQARPGDLLRLANLEGLPKWLGPPIEQAQVTTWLQAPMAESSAAEELFGDAGLPSVMVLGTSFSRTSNFVPFLTHYTGAPVASLAKDGGNFEGAVRAYLDSPTFKQTPAKLVLWEVPERMLQKPLSSAERAWLADLNITPRH